jgi:hypothetical protein
VTEPEAIKPDTWLEFELTRSLVPERTERKPNFLEKQKERTR